MSYMTHLLANICLFTHRAATVLGNFIIHVDITTDPLTMVLNNLLCMGFNQIVSVPTHKHGHTLDLVITRGFSCTLTLITDNSIFGHFCVLFSVISVSKNSHFLICCSRVKSWTRISVLLLLDLSAAYNTDILIDGLETWVGLSSRVLDWCHI